jgi:hypothetical protein
MPPWPENGEQEQAGRDEAARRYGEGLQMGDRHYRAWVGPPEDYDRIAALQVALLLCVGLRETHFFLDVGCGSLRGGRMLIPYLRPGRYFGVSFDFVLAQSVLSHTYPDLAAKALGEVACVLAPEGMFFATFIEGERTPKGSGWVKAAVPYRWERMDTLVKDAGMVARRIDWPHPRQKWFVAGLPEAEPLIEDLAVRLSRGLRT